MLVEEIPYLKDLPEAVREVVAQVLLVILALLIIWFLRRLLTWMVLLPLRKLAQRTTHQYDDMVLDAAEQPVRYFVIALGILVSAEILNVGGSVETVAGHIARSVVIVGLLLLVHRVIDLFMPTSHRLFSITGLTLEERLVPFVRTAIKLVIILIGLVIILQEWGYDVSGLVAGLGLGGLAVSLAAQDTISNLFGFTALVSDRPFNVGEFIKTPDVEGIVEHVGLRSTQVRRLDQSIVYVPNSVMAKSAILNWSRLEKRRLDFVLGITYNATSAQLRELLSHIREFLKAQPTVETDSVVAYFIDFGENSLDILIRGFVRLPDWGEFTAEKERLNLAIMDIVDELGMSIAFPSRSVYIENLPDFLVNKPVPVVPQPPAAEPARKDPSPGESAFEELLFEYTAPHESDEEGAHPPKVQQEGGSETQDMPDEGKS